VNMLVVLSKRRGKAERKNFGPQFRKRNQGLRKGENGTKDDSGGLARRRSGRVFG